MSDDLAPPSSPAKAAAARTMPAADHTTGASTIYRLCEEVISLREMNNRQHQLFERALREVRNELQGSFNSFAADTQRAYQRLREEVNGDKRISLALLNELLEISVDLQHLAANRPAANDAEALARWAEGIDVESRKLQSSLLRLGIHRYDAVLGSAYNPALHERVGSKRVEGMDALRVAEQVEPGHASQQPEFVLRRPKVIVSE
jgi:molecular chaperone GrpE (heat shock protein)